MSGELIKYQPGQMVLIDCYNINCEPVKISVRLGQPYQVHPAFVSGGQAGRFRWHPDADVIGFELGKSFGGLGYRRCGHCRILFGSVIIISQGKGKQPLVFGYDPEPA